MTTESRASAEKWLREQGQISLEAGMDAKEFGSLQTLIGHQPFGLFMAVLAHQRAQAAVLLSNLQLGSPAQIAAASVLQGQIRAVDQIRETVLSIADPQAADAAESLSDEGV